MILKQAILLFFVLLANVVEAITGFGGTIIAITLGAQFFPIDFLVASLAPINTLLSAYIVTRHYAHIDHNELWRRILPFTVIGLPLGFLVKHYAKSDYLTLAYGVFVLIFAVMELLRILMKKFDENEAAVRYPIKKGFPWLVGGGIIHGIYLSGGPLIVYYATRAISDKSKFRSTLSGMWLILNIAVFVSHIVTKQTTIATLKESALMFPTLIAGIVIGDYLHKRIKERTFRIFVFAILIAAGASLSIKAAMLLFK